MINIGAIPKITSAHIHAHVQDTCIPAYHYMYSMCVNKYKIYIYIYNIYIYIHNVYTTYIYIYIQYIYICIYIQYIYTIYIYTIYIYIYNIYIYIYNIYIYTYIYIYIYYVKRRVCSRHAYNANRTMVDSIRTVCPYIYIVYMVQACNPPLPPRDGDGSQGWVYYLPGIQLSCKVSLLPRPPLRGGLGAVCMYLRRLVGIGMYVCVYVCMYVMLCSVMLCSKEV